MIQKPVVTVVRLEPVELIVDMKEAFELRKDRPALWLQRLCIWVLRKLQCYAQTKKFDLERHHVGEDGRHFLERLWENKMNVWDYLGHEPSRLLIGSKDFAEVMGDPESAVHFRFDAVTQTKRGPMDLRVEVVPWMRGFIVMPERL